MNIWESLLSTTQAVMNPVRDNIDSSWLGISHAVNWSWFMQLNEWFPVAELAEVAAIVVMLGICYNLWKVVVTIRQMVSL